MKSEPILYWEKGIGKPSIKIPRKLLHLELKEFSNLTSKSLHMPMVPIKPKCWLGIGASDTPVEIWKSGSIPDIGTNPTLSVNRIASKVKRNISQYPKAILGRDEWRLPQSWFRSGKCLLEKHSSLVLIKRDVCKDWVDTKNITACLLTLIHKVWAFTCG